MKHSKNLNSPVIVVGVPRSGTTVFSVKLANATGIAIAPETHFMPEVFAPLQGLDLRKDEAVDQAITRFESGRWFNDLGLEPQHIRSVFLGQDQRDWSSLFSVILQLFADKNGASRYGEKTPGHYLYVSQFLRWYSDCRIIFVMRDPRAVAASSMRAPFSPPYCWFIARRWRLVWDIYQSVADDSRVHMVRYEDFVSDPDSVLGDVKEWLGLDNEAAPYSRVVEQDESSYKRGWRAQHLQVVTETVNTHSLFQWRYRLTPYEVWATEYCAGLALRSCGYEPAGANRQVWRHGLTHMYRFPKERLALAIAAATEYVDRGGKPRSKQKTLLLVGAVIDRFRLLFASKTTLREGFDNGKHAAVVLGEKHNNQSSYRTLSDEAETLGLFAIALFDLGYDISLTVGSREQFFVASKLIVAFGLKERVRITFDKDLNIGQEDQVKIYYRENGVPRCLTRTLTIDSLNAKRTAIEIDGIFEGEVF